MSSQAYFDEVADQWNAMREQFFSDAVREAALARASVEPGRLAADLGAGTGFVTEALLAARLRVLAVDQSPTMLTEMRRTFGDRVEYLLANAEYLPVPDAHIDYVFANMYLHHVESPPAAIQEMARLLRPGGRLVITDLDAHQFEFLRTEQHDRWLGFERPDVASWLQAAGLEAVSVESIGEKCCATSNCGSDLADVGIFLAYGERPAAR
jgi:ubiquinone/menaquinone biosynthesis C-methylase UbiE